MTHLAAASIHSYTPDGFVRARQLCDDALALPGTPTTQARAYLGRVWHAFYADDEAAVEAGLVAVMELLLAHDDVRLAQHVLPSLNLVLFPALRQRARLPRFVDTVHRRYAEGYGRLQVQVWALLAGLHVLEGRLLEAQMAATHAAQLMEDTGELVYVGFANNLILAMLALARGDVRVSEEVFARCYSAGDAAGGDQDNSVFYVLYLALARSNAGNTSGVEHLAQLVRRGTRPEMLPAHATTIGQVAALAALARGDAAAAVHHLRPVAAQQPSLLERGLAPDARLLLGYAYWRLRQPAEAQAVVTPVLALAHDRGWPSLLLRHGRLLTPLLEWAMRRNIYPITTKRALDMLESYGRPAPVGVPDSQETISVREMEVLRMIGAGASNQEIADALTISVWTVKSHVTSLLAKLGATSRMQAAAQARELRLL
jgi:LuxR family maltose regulon positive regulatory protein